MNRGLKPVTGRTSGGKPYRIEGRLNIQELISRTRCRLCREKGHWARECPNRGKQVPRDGEEAKTSFFVYFGGDHSTAGYIGKGVIDTGWSRFLIGQSTLEKWERMLARRWGLNTQRVQLEKARTFRFGNDETLETRTLAITLWKLSFSRSTIFPPFLCRLRMCDEKWFRSSTAFPARPMEPRSFNAPRTQHSSRYYMKN